jgi:alpha-N-arabinofuranosidase
MLKRKQWLAFATLVAVLTGTAVAEPVTATIDTTHTAQPITKLIFGGFMEPATTRVWAEMLTDRKFFNEVTSTPLPTPKKGWASFFGPQARWIPVGADKFVTMDKKDAYVGEWSPLIKLEATTPHGMIQSGLTLRAGRAYTGRVVLAGTPGTKVDVSLIWGDNPGDRQTISISIRSTEYEKYPMKFTAKADTIKGSFEISGTGSGAFHIGATSLMPADNISGYKADMVRMLKEQGIEIARWPGGNFVSAYDWRDGIGDSDKRPPRRELAWGMMESNDMGIDDFMTFCRLLGAEPYIAVNAGLGDAHSAAEEVEYVNGPATSSMGKWRATNGHIVPYGVKIWGVGNEMYGPWQWGYMANNYYVEKHNQFVRAMRKIDPTVKIIASGATPEEVSWTYIENMQFDSFEGREPVSDKVPFAFGSKWDWTGGLLAHSADYIDYIGEHFYGYPDWAMDAEKQKFVPTNDALVDRVRRMSNRVEFKFEAWDEYVKRMPYLKDKDIKFAFDEWSPRGHAVPGATGAPVASNPMLNPMTEALVYHEFFRHSDKVGLAVATGGMMMMSMDPYGDPNGFRMEGLVMKLLHDHFAGALPVAVSGNSPQHDIQGTVAVDKGARTSGSPTYPLDVFAALSADHKKLVISVVNPTEMTEDCGLSLIGVQQSGKAHLWQLTAPAGAAEAQPTQGPFRSGPRATMAESTLPQVPSKLTVPASSISVYEFNVKQ